MKNSIRCISSAVSLAAGLAIATTAFAGGYVQDLGEAADAGPGARTITIKPDTKWVNVTRDETVKFVDASSGKNFAWRFDTLAMKLDLAAVAPSEVLNGRHIAAYVAYSPNENND